MVLLNLKNEKLFQMLLTPKRIKLERSTTSRIEKQTLVINLLLFYFLFSFILDQDISYSSCTWAYGQDGTIKTILKFFSFRTSVLTLRYHYICFYLSNFLILATEPIFYKHLTSHQTSRVLPGEKGEERILSRSLAFPLLLVRQMVR